MKWIILLIFLGFFIVGFNCVKDYGVHWDEFNSYDFGARWYRYVYNLILKDAPLAPIADESQHDIIHGPIVEMLIAFLLDQYLDFKDTKDIVFFRHYITWFFFYIGTVFFYLLCRMHFNSRISALLGCLFLILHPRIFSHSFYDSVDIPFLALYIISLYTLIRYVRKKTPGAVCLHALACAILIDIRSIGFIIPLISVIIFVWDMVDARGEKKTVYDYVKNTFLFGWVLTGFIILFWPYLWRNPLLCFMEVIRQTPRILWGGTVLYMGEYVSAMNLPWHYVPVWIVITTPVFYLICFIPGIYIVIRDLLRKACDPQMQKRQFIFLTAFLLPIALVIGLQSILYDSWRHLFFIYPVFIIIALTGIEAVNRTIHRYFKSPYRKIFSGTLIVLIACSILSTLYFMIRHHPFQNIYFNCLAGINMIDVKGKFEVDYWGLSYRRALEYIVEHDPSLDIPVYDELFWGPVANNLSVLPVYDRHRIRMVDTPDEAKYVITNYRWRKEGYSYPNTFFSIEVNGADIITVYITDF